MPLTAARLEEELNEQQRRAVTHGQGPLIIIAGAGTGKTRTISARAEYLVARQGVPPEKILALTFGERAANHLADKLEEALGSPGREIWASTFHSFCRRLLEEDGRRIGIPPGFRVLDGVETWMLLRELLPPLKLKHFFNLRDPAAYVSDFREFLGRGHDNLLTPDDYLPYAKSRAAAGAEDAEAEMEKARVYQAVDQRLRETGALTFGGLIERAIELLRSDASVRRQWQERFQFILVDEFQDTNWAQIQLLKVLAEKHKNVTVVGDHDQAIYRFRGASFASFKTFRNLFPKTRIAELNLTTNYRSTDKILAASHALITHNIAEPGESHEPLIPAQQGPSEPVSVLLAPDQETEARAVCDSLQALIQGGFPPGEIAVIYRSRRHRELLTAELDGRGIAYEFRGKGDFFSLAEIGDLLAYARVAVAPVDENKDSLYRILLRHDPHLDFTAVVRLARFQEQENERRQTPAAALAALRRSLQPLRDQAQAELKPLVEQVETEARRLWGAPEAPPAPELTFLDALSQADIVPGLAPETVACLQGFARQVEQLVKAAATLSAEEFLFQVLEQTRLVSALMQEGSRQAGLRLRNLGRLIRFVQEYQRRNPGAGIRVFLAYLELFQEAGGELSSDEDPVADAVQLMTVHGAKGLEYRAVFVIGLSEQRFPQYPHREGEVVFPDALLREEVPPTEYHWEEERRLFYVAMTRAKERLFLSAPTRKVSRFLKEVQESAAEVCDLKQLTRQEDDALQAAAFNDRTRQLIQARARLLERAAAPAPTEAPALEAWIGDLLASGFKLSLLETASRQGQPAESLATHWQEAVESLPAAWAGRVRQELQTLSVPSPAPAAAPERTLKLSHSKIHAYLECPLRYYYQQTFPLVSGPAPQLAFGQWVHAVLEAFYRLMMAGQSPTLEDLLRIFADRYDPAEFDDPDQARGYREQGEALLRAFFDRRQGKDRKSVV
jgi:DNA helicase II / ATP-dependent DNA helicase PcrA